MQSEARFFKSTLAFLSQHLHKDNIICKKWMIENGHLFMTEKIAKYIHTIYHNA